MVQIKYTSVEKIKIKKAIYDFFGQENKVAWQFVY